MMVSQVLWQAIKAALMLCLLKDALVKAQDVLVDDTEVVYVIEPFESMDFEGGWFASPDNLDLTTSDEGDALFGKHSLLVGLNDQQQGESAEFGWLLPTRPHNCHGAKHFSVWYKTQTSSTSATLRVKLWDDSDCIASFGVSNGISANGTSVCADPERLKEYTILSQNIQGEEGKWKEVIVQTDNLDPGPDLRRIRGWKIELIDVDLDPIEAKGDTIIFDQLACVGGGAMLSSAFHLKTSFQEAIQEGTWRETYYQSERSQEFTRPSMPGGQLHVDPYMIEQVEVWGGFTDYSHLAPGAAYYNLSEATDLVIQYYVSQISSAPKRAIFRLVLQDNSHCENNCDADYYRAHERWYSFHSILDRQGNGRIVLPLVGSLEPSTPFWLTGWSGNSGNQELDIAELKGFTLELVLDNLLEKGDVVSGGFSILEMAAAVSTPGFAVDQNIKKDTDSQCITEQDVYFLAEGQHFTRKEGWGAMCCETCSDDPECLYALSTGRDCFLASYIDPNYVSLLSTEISQEDYQSFWMDDKVKRGNWCDHCTCLEKERLIDCKGANLTIVPKMFEEEWKPQILDLRDNPLLVILGSDSLKEVRDELLELNLPASMRHIAPQSFKNLPALVSVFFEEEAHRIINILTSQLEFFEDVCCGFGEHVDLTGPRNGITFCRMQVSSPGADATFEPFYQFVKPHDHFIDENSDENPVDDPIEILTPRSAFMAEAAFSAENCAEFCTINDDCRFFSFDGRVNAENVCYLLPDKQMEEYVCCDPDHYGNEEETIAGWISGQPPRTRHELDNARVLFDPQRLRIGQEYGHFEASYTSSLGSTPFRGAVWVEPTLRSADVLVGLVVTFDPPRFVLYDSNHTATVTVQVHVEDGEPLLQRTLIIENRITSCDEAFMALQDSQESVVYIDVASSTENLIGSMVIFGLILMAIVLVTSVVFMCWTLCNRKARIVLCSQPNFLVMLCSGTVIMSSSIVPMSLDDSNSSLEAADKACMATPWLVTMGFIICFSALFSKIWRVNKIFHSPKFQRIKVTEKDVMVPFIVLFTLNFALMLTWTLYDPLRYERIHVDSTNKYNTYGVCRSDKKGTTGIYIGILATNFGAIILACAQAYQAREISDEYSESKWVGITVASWFQVFVVGIPVMIIVKANPTATYVLRSALLFVLCMSILLFIFLPKVLLHYQDKRQGGSQSSVKVSGLKVSLRKSEVNRFFSCTEVGLETGLDLTAVLCGAVVLPKMEHWKGDESRLEAELKVRNVKKFKNEKGEEVPIEKCDFIEKCHALRRDECCLLEANRGITIENESDLLVIKPQSDELAEIIGRA